MRGGGGDCGWYLLLYHNRYVMNNTAFRLIDGHLMYYVIVLY